MISSSNRCARLRNHRVWRYRDSTATTSAAEHSKSVVTARRSTRLPKVAISNVISLRKLTESSRIVKLEVNTPFLRLPRRPFMRWVPALVENSGERRLSPLITKHCALPWPSVLNPFKSNAVRPPVTLPLLLGYTPLSRFKLSHPRLAPILNRAHSQGEA